MDLLLRADTFFHFGQKVPAKERMSILRVDVSMHSSVQKVTILTS